MQKLLFIDRDGTILTEPADEQIDNWSKFAFVPGVIRNLYMICKNLDFKMVMVTNQDGLGTPSFPEESFWPLQNLMLQTLKSEGIEFHDILIDRSFPADNLPTRKPGTAMLTEYLTSGEYDLAGSFVIGDRETDVKLAQNLGCKAILLNQKDPFEAQMKERFPDTCALVTPDWDDVFAFLRRGQRYAEINRNTKETQIHIALDLDGTGKGDIHTGIGFFDHMLDQIARHSGCNLTVQVHGDLEVDEHHTIEDTGLALGEAFKKALGDKRGIERYGFVAPMDDCLAQVALDFGGRPWLVWHVEFHREFIGQMPTEMFFHFFKSFSDAAGMNLNISADGENEHHKIEGVFKAFARSIRAAIRQDVLKYELPSTKETL
ncbi:MAG: bifunctional histidinol-phosphatase/imidazoleglycerol-phosphate dehydratase HisB [Bacteroidales bacterium]|nr:bifunctional histidinol-phosphatase/imidazoleglycerol-phosphate dehydratase HisB [Bacteroidales bacterium]